MDHNTFFLPDTIEAIKRHAIASYPNEACGIITAADGFIPMENVSPTPTTHFDCHEQTVPYIKAETLLAVVHSHPADRRGRTARNFPSAADMEQQIAFGIPWGLCVTEGETCTDPWFWGDGLPLPPLVGRTFRHGPSGTDGKGDCYALIRDFYLVHMGVEIPDFPRDWNWWNTPRIEDGDLYEQGFAKAGFRAVPATDVRPGDVGLVTHPCASANGAALTPRVTHGVVYVGDGQVLHHKWAQLSRQEPLGEWNRLVKRWVRHSSQPD